MIATEEVKQKGCKAISYTLWSNSAYMSREKDGRRCNHILHNTMPTTTHLEPSYALEDISCVDEVKKR